MTDIDRAAEARITGIAKGTGSPFATLMNAAPHLFEHGTPNAWADLLQSLIDLYYAADRNEARWAVDDAHEALQSLREYTYSGPSRD